ncbi:MAG: hypothetical protein ACQETH_06075 [Candidatus Rifleibacteriota bacterium]
MNIEKAEVKIDKAADKAMQMVRQFLQEEKIKFNDVDKDAVELYMQAKNLTIHLLIYTSNGHLIFRVPGFIRNVNLNRLEILMLIMKIMNEILDIRYEISPDGKSLSACCHHILEDGAITKSQFDLAMMIIIRLVDDTYPQFMQMIYSADGDSVEFASVDENQPVSTDQDYIDEEELVDSDEQDSDAEEDEEEKLKIN